MTMSAAMTSRRMASVEDARPWTRRNTRNCFASYYKNHFLVLGQTAGRFDPPGGGVSSQAWTR